MYTAYNDDDLNRGAKNGEDYIKIEYDAHKKFLRIVAKGNVAWAVAFGSIAVAVTGIIAAQNVKKSEVKIACLASTAVAPVAFATLGIPTTITAIGLAVSAGGIGVLNNLRKYKVDYTCNDYTIIRLKIAQ